jgi:hypothetical protein
MNQKRWNKMGKKQSNKEKYLLTNGWTKNKKNQFISPKNPNCAYDLETAYLMQKTGEKQKFLKINNAPVPKLEWEQPSKLSCLWQTTGSSPVGSTNFLEITWTS